MGAARVDDLPLLAAARVVTRFCLPDEEVPYVVQLLDAFLDTFSSKWTLARSYKRTGSLRLMQYIAARAPADSLGPFYRRWMLNATSWFVAIRGDLAALQWLMESYLPREQVSAAVYAAAANGHVEILDWLHKFHRERIYWNCIEMCGALDYRHDDVVEWLRTHSPPRSECLKLVMRSAAKTGNLVAVRWLYDECHAPAENALVHTQKEGHWEIARWILVNCDLAVRRVNWDGAAASGALSFLKYAYSRALGEPRLSTLMAAALNGHLEIVKWLYNDVHVPLTAGAMRRAAENGNLGVVQWLHVMVCERGDAWMMDCAAKNGHLEVVKWLHAHRDEGCSRKAMSWAAGHGHLDVVKWLHAHRSEGCSKLAMDLAATNGFLEIVQWLHEHRSEGCSTEAMDGAAREGHLEIVQWLHTHRAEVCSTSAMDTAASGGHLNVLKWLQANRKEGGTASAMDWAASNGHLDVVQWLHSNRSEGCTVEAMTAAAVKGHLKVIKWLHMNHDEGCAPNTLSKVAAAGNIKTAKWLYENRSEVDACLALKEAILRARFEMVVYLHLKGVEVAGFANSTFQHPSWELVQWLVANYAKLITGCSFEIPTWDFRFNDWCRQSSMLRTSRNEDVTVWLYD